MVIENSVNDSHLKLFVLKDFVCIVPLSYNHTPTCMSYGIINRMVNLPNSYVEMSIHSVTEFDYIWR